MFRDGLSQMVSQGDAVAVATTTRGTHTAEGKIIEHRGLTDTVGLLRQRTA